MRNNKKADLLLTLYVVALLAVAASMVANIIPYQVDDAFITYRYAKNYLQAGIFAFNLGGEVVEGFSTPAWFWLSVLTGKLFGAESIHYTGLFWGVLSYLALTGLIAACVYANRAIAALACTFVVLSPGLLWYSITGMEQVFFTLLVVLFTLSTIRMLPLYLGMVAAALAAWTRPEAPWLYIVLLISVLQAKEDRLDNKSIGMLFFSLSLALLLLVVVRFSIFGTVLPNTYYAKTASLVAGHQYVVEALRDEWFSMPLLLAAVAAFVGNRTDKVVFLIGLSWLFPAVLEGGDWMMFNRFLLPALGIFLISFRGLTAFFQSRSKQLVLIGITACAIVFFLLDSNRLYRKTQKEVNEFFWVQNAEYQGLVRWIEKAGLDTVALVDIGEMGYRLNVDITDLAGLTDSYVGHLPGGLLEKNIPLEYLLQRKVNLVIIRAYLGPKGQCDASTTAEKFILEHPQFEQHYTLLFTAPGYGAVIYIKKDYPGRQNILASVPFTL